MGRRRTRCQPLLQVRVLLQGRQVAGAGAVEDDGGGAGRVGLHHLCRVHHLAVRQRHRLTLGACTKPMLSRLANPPTFL